MAEALEKILECPICLEKIENPKMLPCQHSFCMKNCLENIVLRNSVDQRRQQLTCPICRKQFPVPENGISGFPNNYVLQNLLDNQEKYRNPEADTSSIKPSAPPPDQKGIEPKPSTPLLSEDRPSPDESDNVNCFNCKNCCSAILAIVKILALCAIFTIVTIFTICAIFTQLQKLYKLF